jgi:hypothetical protein
MRVDFNDVLIVAGVGMVLAGAWLLTGLAGMLVAGGIFTLATGLVRGANRRSAI